MRVFVSYRREDSAGQAGRLADGLVARLGRENVYVDVDSIGPGQDFRHQIREALGGCDVVLAVIGRNWHNSRRRTGRRLEDPMDFVRNELETALGLGIPVVPVLVQGAQMPAAADLPESLQPLVYRNSVELADNRWSQDLEGFVDALLRNPKHRPAQPPVSEPVPAKPSSGHRSRKPWLLALATVVAATAGTFWLLSDSADDKATEASFGSGLIAGLGWPVDDEGSCQKTLRTGTYVVSTGVGDEFCEASPEGRQAFRDVRVAVDVTWDEAAVTPTRTGPSAYAVLKCRRSEADGSIRAAYTAIVSPSWEYRITRRGDGDIRVLVPTTRGQGVPMQAGSTHHLALTCTGKADGPTRIRLAVDGHAFPVAHDPHGLAEAGVSLGIWRLAPKTITADFTNMTVTDVSNGKA